MATDFRTLPSVATGGSLRTRNIFSNLSAAQIQWLVALAIIDGTLSRDVGETPVDLLRAGVILGKVTSGGKYRPSIIGLTNGAITSGSATSITVHAVVATEVARLIAAAAGNVNLTLTSVPSAAGTVAHTNIVATAASGTTITISSASLPDSVDKSIIAPRDGSETPVTVISDLTGIDVVDTLGNNVDQALGRFLRGADLIATQIVAGDGAFTDLDTSLQAWIKTNLGALFTFDNAR